MLRYIEISNIALIDRASIDFGPGLCVLTGETGAGKSIVIDSINAVLGAKATKDVVRKDAETATVTAIFSRDGVLSEAKYKPLLEKNGLDGGADELVLTREINVSGKNVCRVNGRIVASAALREIGEMIVDLHGQHENHSLMKRENHIDMIDSFGGMRLLSRREEYGRLYSRRRQITGEIGDLTRSEHERARNAEMLTFQINEIKTVRPQPGEDERLSEQIAELANAERINEALDAAHTLLDGGENASPESPSALANIGESIRALSQIEKYSPDYRELSGRLSEARLLLEDAASSIRRKRDSVDREPGRLDKLSERLNSIERLKRKYGGTVKEIHKFYKSAVDKLSELSDSERAIGELKAELAGVTEKMELLADELSLLRRESASIIENGVVSELEALEMKNCRFKVDFAAAGGNSAEFNPKGRDQLEFLFCANPGEELKPLVKIASGGEMSRVMLAIKSVLVGADDIPTMIFDEIDAGISGKAAARVAERMHLLSRGRQIICVTHLAQIACMADDQYMIEKTSSEDTTRTGIDRLGYNDRVIEISRMLGGGSPTEASTRLSRELLNRAESFKSAN